MDLQRLLSDLSEAPGEAGAAAVLETRLAPLGPCRRDVHGSLFFELDGGGEGHILLTAHIDEIGFVVTGITDEGFLKVGKCGGIDRRVLPGAEVVVCGKEPLFGVFCTLPPHLSGDKLSELKDMAVDIGLGKERAENAVRPGDRVYFRQKAEPLQNDCLTGKALDDRAGAAALVRAAEELARSGKAYGKVTFLFATQEELGSRGAAVGAFGSPARQAVAVDVSFGRSFCHTEPQTGVLGKGPMIGVAPVLDLKITDALVETARAKEIPFQFEGMGGKTSTDADAVSVAGAGIPCGLLSIPLRYMHTPAEIVSLTDTEHTGRLLAEFVLRGGAGKGADSDA